MIAQNIDYRHHHLKSEATQFRIMRAVGNGAWYVALFIRLREFEMNAVAIIEKGY